MRTLVLVGLALSLLSCATLPSPSPPMPANVAEPVAFLNGLRDGKEGTCDVTLGGKRTKLPCTVYKGPQASVIVAVRNQRGILIWISWVRADGVQKVLWSRPQQEPIPGILVA